MDALILRHPENSVKVRLADSDQGRVPNNAKPANKQLAEPGWNSFRCPQGGQDDLHVEQVADWLRIFVTQDKIVELRAIEVEVPGLDLPLTRAGFFDFDHLGVMAAEALALSSSARGVYFSLNPVNPDLLARVSNRVKTARKGDLATDKDVLRRQWLLIDIDPCRVGNISSTAEEKAKARTKAQTIKSFLQSRNWPDPILADSGNGYHLLHRIEMPANEERPVKAILQALAARFDDEAVKVDTSVFNLGRIVRLYGTWARKGDSTEQRPHRRSAVLEVPAQLTPVDPLLLIMMAEEAAEDDQAHCPKSVDHVAPQNAEEKKRRARAYLGKFPPAISGKGGHNRTYEAACRLVLGFDLSARDAFPLLREWNQCCEPPWTEEELSHKLDDANAEPGPRGYLLAQRDEPEGAAEEHPLPGPTFPITIPDFVLADRERVLVSLPARRRGRRRIRQGLHWAFHHAVVTQRCSIVVLPDVLLAQVVWGADGWPKNWRYQLSQWIGLQTLERQGEGSCPDFCPFAGTKIAHQHFVFDIGEGFLGALEGLGTPKPGDVCLYDFRSNSKQLSAERRADLKSILKSGRAMPAYLPVLLFGGSPRVGLSVSQMRLLRGVVSELTRVGAGKSSTRPDRAHQIQNGRVPGDSGEDLITCPFLTPDKSYVVFGGNSGKRKDAGRGYQIVGRTFKGWLCRAGYQQATIEADRWGTVRRFLADLADLSRPFHITVAAYHGRRREWRNLQDMLAMTRSESGRTWLDSCRLRIYAPADYLVLWRRFFASRLGFSYIPGGEWQPPPSTNAAPSTGGSSARILRTASDVRGWLRDRGMAQKALATHLGCSPARVSAQLTGRQRWSRKFQADVNALVRRLSRELH